MAQEAVTLLPGESKVSSFTATPQTAKTYQVSIDGLTGSFQALAISAVPDISIGIITNADIRSDPSFAYCWITLDAIIRNRGDGGGNWSVKWYVNGSLYCSKSGYLAAGAHAFANAPPYNPSAYGTYNIDVIFDWNGHHEEYHRQCIVHQY